VEGESPEEALKEHLAEMAQAARDLFYLDPEDADDEKIAETLYAIRADGLVAARSL
jgi:hypothetical protein